MHHSKKLNPAVSIKTVSIMAGVMLSVIYPNVTYVECCIKTIYAECRYAECHYTKCRDTTADGSIILQNVHYFSLTFNVLTGEIFFFTENG
jgi:hypothetical protein